MEPEIVSRLGRMVLMVLTIRTLHLFQRRTNPALRAGQSLGIAPHGFAFALGLRRGASDIASGSEKLRVTEQVQTSADAFREVDQCHSLTGALHSFL